MKEKSTARIRNTSNAIGTWSSQGTAVFTAFLHSDEDDGNPSLSSITSESSDSAETLHVQQKYKITQML